MLGKSSAKQLVFTCALLMLFGAIYTATAQGDTITISGQVTYADDGSGVASVEVFLWNSDASLIRYTCTDENGNFIFEGIPSSAMISGATGPDVDNAEICDNPYFLDDDNKPLVVQYYEAHTASSTFDFIPANTVTALNYSVERWPTNENRGLEAIITAAQRLISERNFELVDRQMNIVIRRANSLYRRGLLAEADRDTIITYAEGYIDAFRDGL